MSLRPAGKETIMIRPRSLVTGATGKTGGVVGTELLKAGYSALYPSLHNLFENRLGVLSVVLIRD